MARMGVGGHHRPRGLYDIWLTPRAILASLGEFDLDPCAAPSPRPWATAKRHVELPDDGLEQEWAGRVWLNPPYHRDVIAGWMRKMAEHGSGTALLFARTETETWKLWIWPQAHSILFIAGRLDFCLPDGTRVKHNCGAPSALIAYSEYDTQKIAESGIRGALVRHIDLQ